MSKNVQRGMEALFQGNALGFRAAINTAIVEKAARVVDRRRVQIMGESSLVETAYQKDIDDNKPVTVHGVKGMQSKPFKKKFKNMAHYERWHEKEGGNHQIHHVVQEGEDFAPGQPKSEREMIDLHGMEMHNEPNADENNFTADYIDPDDSDASGQRDANENDVPVNSAEKLKKVVMHGTGDQVYDDEDADGSLGEEEEREGDDPEEDEGEEDEDRHPLGEGYIQEKSFLKQVKRAAQRLNPNSPASKVHRFKKSIRGVSGAAHGTLRSKKLVRKIAQESADLEEGVWNSIKRAADKLGGWQSSQARRIRSKASRNERRAGGKANGLPFASPERRKHTSTQLKNTKRYASSLTDGPEDSKHYGAGYLGSKKGDRVRSYESLQLTERNKENASKRRAWQAGHSVYGPKARENKKTGKLVQGDRFASQSAARLSSFQHDSQDRTHGKGNVADARRAGRKALAGKHGSDLARHVDQKKGFAKLDRKAGGAPAKATRRAKRNRKG